MARILAVTNAAIAEAAAALGAGDLVAFPTETVYGLGANALNADAVARIFAAKGRPATNPLIVHIAQSADASALADTSAPAFARLAAAFWPGPLTLVLPKQPIVPDIVTAGGPTVALRVPRHPVALALLQAAGVPLAAPSANRSEQLSPTRAQHVVEGLEEAVDIVLDGGPAEVGLESTVLDLTEQPPRLLRPGHITCSDLEAVLGTPLAAGPSAAGPARSPGQSRRHYAPRTPLHVVENVWEIAALTPGCAVLAHTPPPVPPPSHVRAAAVLSAGSRAYAAALYESLHRLDSLHPSIILAEAVPEDAAWLAVRDRLRRASTR